MEHLSQWPLFIISCACYVTKWFCHSTKIVYNEFALMDIRYVLYSQWDSNITKQKMFKDQYTVFNNRHVSLQYTNVLSTVKTIKILSKVLPIKTILLILSSVFSHGVV